MNKMKVEIWSDIMCPFCYIGKRHFEAALEGFAGKDQLEIEWKSFQLDPSIPEVPADQGDVYRYVANRKGISYEQSKQMHEDVVRMAKNAGLDYNFEKVLVTNSLKGHRLIQLAKSKGLGDAAEERLFLAYFTEGKDLNDGDTLIALGKEIGLPEQEILEAMVNPVWLQQIEAEVDEAQALGVRGVPFFVLDRKYGISGAQPAEVMLRSVEKAYAEWKQDNAGGLQMAEGAACVPGGDC
jgi:protein disulfide-isomerase